MAQPSIAVIADENGFHTAPFAASARGGHRGFGLALLSALFVVCFAACEDQEDLVARRSTGYPPWVEAGQCEDSTETQPSAATSQVLERLWQNTAERALCICQEGLFGGTVDVEALGEVNIGPSGINIERDVSVAGDLYIMGAVQAAPGAQLEVGADLWVGQSLLADGVDVFVGGDASLGGELRVADWAVGGRFVMPDGVPFLVTGIGVGEPLREAVATPPGCPCDPLSAAQIEAIRAESMEVAPVGDDGVIAHCGVGRFEPGSMMDELRITGAGLLLVDGRTAIQGDLLLSAEPGRTLDIILTEDLHVAGSLRTLTEGGTVRVYLASTGNLHLAEDGEFSGLLAMPEAELLVSQDFQLHGSALVRRLFVEGGGSMVVTDTE